MEELYKVMDDLLDVEFQMKSGIDLLKELVLRMDGKISARIEGNEFCVEIVFPK